MNFNFGTWHIANSSILGMRAHSNLSKAKKEPKLHNFFRFRACGRVLPKEGHSAVLIDALTATMALFLKYFQAQLSYLMSNYELQCEMQLSSGK